MCELGGDGAVGEAEPPSSVPSPCLAPARQDAPSSRSGGWRPLLTAEVPKAVTLQRSHGSPPGARLEALVKVPGGPKPVS